MTEEPTVSRASGDFYIYAKSKKTHRWSRRSAGAEKSLKKEEVQHHISCDNIQKSAFQRKKMMK